MIEMNKKPKSTRLPIKLVAQATSEQYQVGLSTREVQSR
jgi:hypothetical protein